MRTATAGERLFAAFAHAPNERGYCGPAGAQGLFDLAVTGESALDVRALARRFSGVWPYLLLLAEFTGRDPLDEAVGRAYWLGGPLLGQVDRARFAARLLETIGAEAGHYWKHLEANLLPETSATHAFHVLGVYPWSRLLVPGPVGLPLSVLDNCRIRWAQVASLEGDEVVVRSPRLGFDGTSLHLDPPAVERLCYRIDGQALVADPRPGEWVALHWGQVCARLTPEDVARLHRSTRWQLDATNGRLCRPDP